MKTRTTNASPKHFDALAARANRRWPHMHFWTGVNDATHLYQLFGAPKPAGW